MTLSVCLYLTRLSLYTCTSFADFVFIEENLISLKSKILISTLQIIALSVRNI